MYDWSRDGNEIQWYLMIKNGKCIITGIECHNLPIKVHLIREVYTIPNTTIDEYLGFINSNGTTISYIESWQVILNIQYFPSRFL